MDFIVLSDDWGRHPSSSQHLFRRLAREHRTLWVETIGLRPPRLRWADGRRMVEKLGRMFAPSVGLAERAPWCETPPLLRRNAPPMHPFYGSRFGAGLNDALLRPLVRRAASRAGLERPVLLTTVPNAAGLVGHLGESCAIYYCVDDFETWPGYAADAIRSLEARLVASVDGLVVTADALAERRGRPGLPCLSLPHGVDGALFAAGGPRPEPLENAGHPLLMSLGLYDERIDVPLLGAVLDANPAWHLAFVGPRTAAPNALDTHPRVQVHPGVAYTEVPAWLHAADCLLIPYVRNGQTDAINPLKLREFLATGRPVATTALPEVVRSYGALVPTGDGPDGYSGAIARALSLPNAAAADRQGAVAADDWHARAAQLLDFIERVRATRG